MVTKKLDLYNTTETITLPNTKLEVKYINPSTIQVSTFQTFIINGFSKLRLTPNEISSLSFVQLRDKALEVFNSLTEEDRMTMVAEMLVLEVDTMLEIIKDCFPEVTNPRLLKDSILFDMVITIFSTLKTN